MAKMETILKRFDNPDKVRVFEKGKFEVIRPRHLPAGMEVVS
jgi:hypothetical protein